MSYPLTKGKTAKQAHVALPEGTFEEEHGRKGFYGKSAHLYHAHPPTGWIRFEGKLRPHCFDLNALRPADLADAEGTPGAPFSATTTSACSSRAAASRCRSTSAMPMATSCTSSIAVTASSKPISVRWRSNLATTSTSRERSPTAWSRKRATTFSW